MLYEMRLVGLAVDPYSNTPIVILKDKASVEAEEQRKKQANNKTEDTGKDKEQFVEFINFDSGFTTSSLKNAPDEQILPIWIGELEANAIATELLNITPTRPMTHDLIKDIITLMGGRLDRVIVTNLEENTFFSTLEIITNNDEIKSIDARPSDALALALRCNAKIFVHERVLLKTLQNQTMASAFKEENSNDIEKKWKEDLEMLSKDALKKYKQ